METMGDTTTQSLTCDTIPPVVSSLSSTTAITSRILTTTTVRIIKTGKHSVKRLRQHSTPDPTCAHSSDEGDNNNPPLTTTTPPSLSTAESSASVTTSSNPTTMPLQSSSIGLDNTPFRESTSTTLLRLGLKKYLCGTSYKVFARIFPNNCYVLYKSFNIVFSDNNGVNNDPPVMPFLRYLDIYANIINSRYDNSFDYKFTFESSFITCCMPRFLVTRKSKNRYPDYTPITDAFSKAFLVDQITKKLPNCKSVKFITTEMTRYYTYASKAAAFAENTLIVSEDRVVSSNIEVQANHDDDDIYLILFQPVFMDNETLVCIIESDFKL